MYSRSRSQRTDIGDLKKIIKNEKPRAFQHVDADDLNIWQVRPPVFRLTWLTVGLQVDLPADKHAITDLRLDDDNALSPVKQLGELFQSVLSKHNIHIVVRAPPDGAYRNILQPSDCVLNVPSGPVQIGAAAPQQLITLNCWVVSDDPDRVFPVKIAAEESVGALKKAIKEEMKPAFDHIPANCLDLWKVSELIAQRPALIKLEGVHCPRGS
jgi:hypothetical protein